MNRLFVAIPLPESIRTQLSLLQSGLQGARWIKPENIHLTLKFLGNVSETNLEVLKKLLESRVSDCDRFDISVGEMGAFPSTRRPRVVWVKVQSPDQLLNLQRSIEEGTTRLGYAQEKRTFMPHLTLGRVSRNAAPEEVRQLSDLLDSTQVGFLGAMRVQSVHLFQSDLQPGGAVYTRLFSSYFRG